MSDASNQSSRQLQRSLYPEMDARLRDSRFGSGAAEAHGMLCALACRDVQPDQRDVVTRLFAVEDDTDLTLLTGLFELVYRDLNSPGFEFDLLLPDDDSEFALRLEAVSNWCGGFMQGLLHDGGDVLAGMDEETREAVDDISDISALDIHVPQPQDGERELAEIIEFLRVAAQLVYEALSSAPGPGAGGASTDIN